jgi:hypothetical protein
MATLGIYWSVIAYVEWTDSPVITTVETTAFAINNVPFPAVTICAPGLYACFFEYFNTKNWLD